MLWEQVRPSVANDPRSLPPGATRRTNRVAPASSRSRYG
jgi:hypothetical protein